MMTALLIIGGLLMILVGANALVEGAGNVARRLGVSEFVIGLTIVGIGTSSPEMVVSFISAAQGNGDMAVGNIVGSNIFNILMILGLTALIRPLTISSHNLKRDVSACIAASLLLLLPFVLKLVGLADGLVITRWIGLVFIALFAFYMYLCFKQDSGKEEEGSSEGKKTGGWAVSTAMIVAGLLLLIFGGRFFVNGASALASSLGLSDALIAITIMAGGTSLPELATCVVAAVRKKGDLALGNVIGSNISNIFLILGGSALISPLAMEGISMVDIGLVVLSSVMVGISAFTFRKGRLDRVEGAIFLAAYILYIAYLVTGGANLW